MLLWVLVHSTSTWCLILPGTKDELSKKPAFKDKNKMRRAGFERVKDPNYLQNTLGGKKRPHFFFLPISIAGALGSPSVEIFTSNNWWGCCPTPWFPYPGLEGPKSSRMYSPEFFLSCSTSVIQFIHQIFTGRNTIMCQEHYSILGTWNKIT